MRKRITCLTICLLLGGIPIKAIKYISLSKLLSRAKQKGLNISYSPTLTDTVLVNDSILSNDLNIASLESLLSLHNFTLKNFNDTYVLVIAKKKIKDEVDITIPEQTNDLSKILTHKQIDRVKPEPPLAPPPIQITPSASSSPSLLFQYRFQPNCYLDQEKVVLQNTLTVDIFAGLIGIVSISYERFIGQHWSHISKLSTRVWAGSSRMFKYGEINSSVRYFVPTNRIGLFLQCSTSVATFDIEGFSNTSFFYTELPKERHQGLFVCGSIALGYRHTLIRTIFIEPTIGYGYSNIRYTKPLPSYKHQWGLKNICVNIGYMF